MICLLSINIYRPDNSNYKNQIAYVLQSAAGVQIEEIGDQSDHNQDQRNDDAFGGGSCYSLFHGKNYLFKNSLSLLNIPITFPFNLLLIKALFLLLDKTFFSSKTYSSSGTKKVRFAF